MRSDKSNEKNKHKKTAFCTLCLIDANGTRFFLSSFLLVSFSPLHVLPLLFYIPATLSHARARTLILSYFSVNKTELRVIYDHFLIMYPTYKTAVACPRF